MTYATWDPANKSSKVTLSSGNLVATETSGSEGWGAVRSTIGVTTGKWYWEVTVTQVNLNRGDQLGVGNESLTNFDDFPGHTANGWVKLTFGNTYAGKMNNNLEAPFVGALADGDVLGWYLDVGAGTIGMILNGVDKGIMYSGLTGTTIYAIWGSGSIGTGIATANFGASAFTYSVPSGYNPGLYELPFSPFPSHYNT